MKKVVYIVLICFGYAFAKAQSPTFTLLNSTPLSVDVFCGVDKYGHRYTFEGNSIVKSGLGMTHRFSDLRLGTPTSLDVLNPLKLVAFYEMTQTVVILDNKLTEITRINFNALEEPFLVTHARQAGDRKLWLFNADTQSVVRFDYQTNTITLNFQPQDESAIALATDFNNCWTSSGTKITHYNNYGTLLQEYDIPDVTHIATADEKIIAYSEAQWLYMDSENKTFVPVAIPTETVVTFSFLGDHLYVYDGTEIQTFKITLTQ